MLIVSPCFGTRQNIYLLESAGHPGPAFFRHESRNPGSSKMPPHISILFIYTKLTTHLSRARGNTM
jgi:hypothetical protein